MLIAPDFFFLLWNYQARAINVLSPVKVLVALLNIKETQLLLYSLLCTKTWEAKGGLVVFKTTLFSPKFHRTIGHSWSGANFGNEPGGSLYHRLVPFLDLHPPSFSHLKNAGSENFRSWYSQKLARWYVAPQKRYACAWSYGVVHQRVALRERHEYDLLGWCVCR